MSAQSNNLLSGFLVFSVLIFVVSLLVREDAAIEPVVDTAADTADSLASTSAPSTMHEDTTSAPSTVHEDTTSAPSTVHEDNLTLASYDLEKPARRFKLPKQWREISGLAMLGENRLLAHDDERGVVFEIDYRDGSIVKSFAISDQRDPVADDFEGIAAAEGRVYLVSSSGRLYEFVEGTDGETVLYNLYTTGIGRDHEIEGLAYDPDQRVLLLISKNPKNPRQTGLVAICRWSLDTKQLVEDGHILIPAIALSSRTDSKRFQPSGIERHPVSGNYFVVAARQRAIAEITPQGQVLAVADLAVDRHPQTEGIAFASDNTLIVSDEGVSKRATLTFYPVSKGR
ncbi:MAG: hypothetical protein OXI58_15845 [Gemmatimonadota bacterium]|nr:hypothetical protein [Gemmatimonadota bacterium]